MPEISINRETYVVTIDFTEVEYKALSWVDEDPLSGIVERINGKVEYAIEEAVRYELSQRFQDPGATTMPASKEELILSSTRPSLAEQRGSLEALKNGEIEVVNGE